MKNTRPEAPKTQDDKKRDDVLRTMLRTKPKPKEAPKPKAKKPVKSDKK